MFRSRSQAAFRLQWVASVALTLTVMGGCSDGSGGGGAAATAVMATSFVGTPVAPGGAPPEQFLDEVLLVTFGGPIDTLALGGVVIDPATSNPQVFSGVFGSAGEVVLYLAFASQSTAAQAFQVIDDATGIPHTGIVGRSLTDPNTLVFDPRIRPGNPMALPPSFGFDANRQYDVYIPENSALNINGRSVDTFGSPPPVVIPPFDANPGPSSVFVTGSSLVPDIIDPSVTLITTMSLQAGGGTSADPIPFNDTFLISFSEPLDTSSISNLSSVVVRNRSITTSEQPTGIIVPTDITISPNLSQLFVTPVPSLGEGPFDIVVEVGNADPTRTITDQAGNPLRGVTVENFTTIAAPGEMTPSTLLETFDDTARQDATFVPRYNAAEWNASTPGALAGLPLSGTAGAVGGSGPGARTQVAFEPLGAGTPPVTAFFSPFDDNQTNNLGATINPNGGSHLQLLYQIGGGFGELPNGLADSIELLEWRSASGANAATYNGFTMQMGHTSASAAQLSPDQLTVVYDANFTFDNPQNEFIMPPAHPSPTNSNANESPVVVIPPQPYITPTSVDFTPFPLLSLPFDVDHNRQGPNLIGQLVNPNLMVDINIDAGSMPTGNLWNGSTPVSAIPFRRLISGPGAVSAFALDAVVYHSRFTFVKKNSSARTAFFDAGQGTAPEWFEIALNPGIEQRAPGTAITIRIQGADSAAPLQGLTSSEIYVSRSGVVNPSAFATVSGKRFLRLQIELESDTTTNAAAFIDDLLLAFVP